MFNEKNTIEDHLVQKLTEQGWKYVPANELVREGYDEPLLLNDLARILNKINSDIGITEEEIKQTINELKLRGSGQEGVKQILEYFKKGVPVKFEKERIVQNVKLFDYKKIENNEFIVTRQAVYQSGDKHIRTDIMLYVNGIPLVIIECKNPVSLSADWYEAYKQIKGYEKDVSELFKYTQIGIAVESIAKYFPIVPWQEDVKIYEWKEENKDSIDSTVEMLSPAILLDIVKNFLFFRIEFGKATKVITRYMQYRAVNKIVNRVLGSMESKESKESEKKVESQESLKSQESKELKRKGLIWHWQGSGKTLTMIFAAYKLFYNRQMETPTIFFIVDRSELETQLKAELHAVGIIPHLIDSVVELKKVIMHDEYKGRRDIIITLIHKFRAEELAELTKALGTLKETIQSRKNVIAFVDEGHRTQYGTLASQMKEIFKGGFIFAFTGTPIAKEGRDTYKEFSNLPEEQYLDKYFIAESINDGFTKKIVYQPRLEKDVHLNKSDLETFIGAEVEEIPEEFIEKVKEDVRKKLTSIKVYLENPDRIEKIAKDIKEHFNENVNNKFKAMVVAVSRKACVLYKRELDKYFPKEYSEIVMTFNPEDKKSDDKKLIQEYYDELSSRFKGKDIDEIRKTIVERFKDEENPKILIVTDMLLTGFDAPVLQTMYLDKLLKEHRLLQAIARTNRPYKDIKEAGLIIDYVGILENFEKAFEMYSKEDIKQALYDTDELREEFIELISETMKVFEGISKQSYDRNTLLKALEAITMDNAVEKTFVENYKTLRRLFELLGPDAVKVEYFADYKWLTAVYIYYLKEISRDNNGSEAYFEKYFSKTLKYVHNTTQIEELRKDLPEIEFGEKYFELLEEKLKNKEEKAANIVFTLNKYVLVHKNDIIYLSIADKVEKIIEEWKEKNKDYDKIYRKGLSVWKEFNQLKSRQKKLEFSDLEYSILLILEKQIGEKKELIDDIKKLSEVLDEKKFKGWVLQPTARKNIEKELRSFLRKASVKYDFPYEQVDEMFSLVRDGVIKYGENN